MKKKRFSVEQIIGVLKQAQARGPVAEVIRKAGISEQTFYRWKSKYAGLEGDQVRQMAQWQEENHRLVPAESRGTATLDSSECLRQLIAETGLEAFQKLLALYANNIGHFDGRPRHARRGR